MQQKKSSEMLQTLKQQRVLLAISIFTIVTVLLLINNYQLTRCAFRIKKSKLITYHNDIIQFSPKNQNNE